MAIRPVHNPPMDYGTFEGKTEMDASDAVAHLDWTAASIVCCTLYFCLTHAILEPTNPLEITLGTINVIN